MIASVARHGFLADLVGAGDRLGRTILFGAIVGRLAILPVAAVIYALAPDTTEEGHTGAFRDLGFVDLFTALAVAPVLESLIVLFLVWLVGGLLRAPIWLTALLVGAAFVPMHGLVLVSPTVFPMFALMAAIQMNWRRKGRTRAGFWIVTAIHALGNFSAAGVALINRLG